MGWSTTRHACSHWPKTSPNPQSVHAFSKTHPRTHPSWGSAVWGGLVGLGPTHHSPVQGNRPPAQNENFNLKTSANRKEEGSRFPGFTPSVSKPCTLTTPREGGSPVVGVVPAMSERQARQRAAFADVVARGVRAVAEHSTAPNHTGRGKRN